MKPVNYHNQNGDKIIPVSTPDAFSALMVRNMNSLGLTSAEFVFVQYLMSQGFSWDAECRVSMSLKEMHRLTGLALGTVHAAKHGLVEKGFVKILPIRNKQRTNTYDLRPLKEKLVQAAQGMLPPKDKADIGESTTPNGQ